MLIDQIKQDLLQARRDRDSVASALLSTLLAEASAVGKNHGNRDSTDAEVLAVVTKFVKNLTEIINLPITTPALEQQHAQAVQEHQLLQRYVPQQLSADELKDIIGAMILTLPTTAGAMGAVMSQLRQNYAGRYNGQVASAVAKELLSR